MKTAISIPDNLFREVERFAEEHKCSRSKVFVFAIKEFLEKLESRKLLNVLNEVYSIAESKEEKTVREKARRHYSREVLKERY